jgi:hypothetical protein
MSNDLVSQAAATGLAILAGGNNPFTSLATEYNVPTGAFLKFSGNTGEYSYKGQTIEHGSCFAFNMMEMRKGWICWKDGKPVEQFMVRVMSGESVLDKEELPDHSPYKEGEGWQEQIGVPVRDLEGGEQLEINLSNISGRNALIRLASDFGTKVRMNIDEEGQPKIPIVEVSASSFTSKNFPGKKWAPAFKIVGWMSVAELTLLSENAGTVDSAQHEPAADTQPPQQSAASNNQTAPQQSSQPAQQSAPMSVRKGFRVGQRT